MIIYRAYLGFRRNNVQRCTNLSASYTLSLSIQNLFFIYSYKSEFILTDQFMDYQPSKVLTSTILPIHDCFITNKF